METLPQCSKFLLNAFVAAKLSPNTKHNGNEFRRVPVFKKLAWRLSVNLAERIGRQSGRVIFLNRRVCVKYGPAQPDSEARTMLYLSQYTSVPVPRVLCSFVSNGLTYIVMERLEGRNLAQDWHLRDESSKNKILTQLRTYIAELRHIPHPPTQSAFISNIAGGPISDTRLPRSDQHGPFSNVKDFHTYLRCGVGEDAPDDMVSGVRRLISLHETMPDAVCFTHGDLGPPNIMVHNDKITGILDWEFAGWMPMYWEYVTACLGNPMTRFKQKEVEQVLTPLPEALEMEILRRECFGDY